MHRFFNFSLSELVLVTAIFTFDRVSKYIISKYPLGYGKKIFDFFYITYIENTGAAFGMGKNLNPLFVFVTIILIGVILYYKNYLAGFGLKAKTAVLFILGGAFGNLYDRIVYGRVIDFLDFRIWPVFNIADSFITIGGILLAVSFLKKRQTTFK